MKLTLVVQYCLDTVENYQALVIQSMPWREQKALLLATGAVPVVSDPEQARLGGVRKWGTAAKTRRWLRRLSSRILAKPPVLSQRWSSLNRSIGRRSTAWNTPQSRVGSATKQFSLRVRLEETGEMFRLHNCRQETTVRELREELDLVSGIPYHFQRVCYLDQGVLMDDSTLGFHDVVPGGTLSMYIWPQDGWKELVFAAVEGDTSKLSCLGVTEDSLYRTPHSLLLKAKKLKEWIDDRAFVALYITAHRGHSEALRFLLANGTNCQGRTPLGRTALHAAAATGQITTINLLLDYGALLSDKDFKGETVAEIARRLKTIPINFILWKRKTETKNAKKK
ncbi:ankyrin repeat domain-containing protein 60 [Monodelphis domestica]|uniref:ankyrin repeat domain-containing protein 60 n=1 Tax=Monodelphis domestica TaxID=13616 RepID=UPI0024E22748|nr:ankyrin repeat domain-containing protein 60 [Monodelphis domestica]